MSNSVLSQSTSPFGIGAHLTGGEEYRQMPHNLNMMNNAGIGWVRTDFSWSLIQPNASSWNYDVIDKVVKNAKESGLQILPIMGYNTSWANPAYLHLDHWLLYIETTVRRYKDDIHYWEIWNEPNLFWENPNPEHYTILLKATYERIKQIDPNIKVVFGGTSGVPYDFYEGALKLGAGNYCDIFNIHPYRGKLQSNQHIKDYEAELKGFYELLGRYQIINPEVWITEMGWSTWKTLSKTNPNPHWELKKKFPNKASWKFAVFYDDASAEETGYTASDIKKLVSSQGEQVSIFHMDELDKIDLNQFDALFLQPWEKYNTQDSRFKTLIYNVFSYMRKNGKVYLYGKEPNNEQIQADALVQSSLLSFAYGINKFFWYEFQSPEDSQFDREDHFGIVHKDLTPKPAYWAYKQLTKMYPNGLSKIHMETLEQNKIQLVSWKNSDGELVYALWSTAIDQKPVWNFKGKVKRIVAQNGETITTNPRQKSVELSSSVIYIVSSSPLQYNTH